MTFQSRSHRLLVEFLTLLCLVSGVAAAQQPAEGPTLTAEPSKFAKLALESPRSQPADYVRDILVLIDLGEAQHAKPLFEGLAKQQLTDEQRVALVHRFGTGKIHSLAHAKGELGDGVVAFVRECIRAVADRAAAPERLQEITEKIAGGNQVERRKAAADILSSGDAGIAACLTAIAQSPEAEKQNRLREALVSMAPQSLPALQAALAAPKPEVRQQAAWALGQAGDRVSLPLLAAMAAGAESNPTTARAALWAVQKLSGVTKFDGSSAAGLIEQSLSSVLQGVPPRAPDEAGMVPVWTWPTGADTPAATRLPVGQAGVVRAGRLASGLWRIDQGQQRNRVQALTLVLQGEWLLRLAGNDQASLSGPALGEATGQQLSEALLLSLEIGYTGSATALCKELGRRRVPDVLYTQDAKPSALATALEDPHPAVRFSALEAIMAIEPQRPFPGSSAMAEVLLGFTNTEGAMTAVVAMPKAQDAATVAGWLSGGGIQAAATNIGSQVVKRSSQDADVEFVVVDLSILKPNAREVLFQLRRQRESALLPIVLLAPDGRLTEAKQLAREHDAVLAAPRPHTAEATLSLAEKARGLMSLGWPMPEERSVQAVAAAGWIKTLLSDGPRFYNLRGKSDRLLAAVGRAPDLEAVIPSLELVGTAQSQFGLLILANQETLPIQTRDTAAASFGKSVKQHGLLLTKQQILAQYDRYNDSENSDKETQRILGTVLDSIEAKRERTQ